MNDQIQLQFPILWAITGALFLVFVVALAWAFIVTQADKRNCKKKKWIYYGSGVRDADSFIVSMAALSLTAFTALVSVITMVPFNSKYWVITHPTGVVESISQQFDSGTGSLSNGYVLRLEGDATNYVLDDPRGSVVHEGQQVILGCTLQWVYGAQDIENCSITMIDRSIAPKAEGTFLDRVKNVYKNGLDG